MIPSSKYPQLSAENEIFSLNLSNFKIRKIEKNPNIKISLLDKIHNTKIYHFYTKHWKRVAFVHWFFVWLWRHGNPLYLKLSTRMGGLSKWYALRWRPLIKLSEFTQKREIDTYRLAGDAVVETPVPQVFPSYAQGYLVSPHDRYKFPEIFVATINNGMVYGGSNVVLVGGDIVCHDLYDFKRDFTSEELHGRTLINANHKNIRLLLNDEEPKHIPAAASFVDACAPNYAHWLTEVLTRVVMFCADERFQNIPIVVDNGLHKNIMESLLLVTGIEREIYLLPLGRALCCDSLYVTSVTGYVPFDWRSKKYSDCSHGKFSPLAFNVLCDHFKNLAQKIERQTWPEKIFIRRNSENRKIVNFQEVENFFLSNDYVVVEPEKLTFLKQVALFQNAKIIIGSSGAALANLIFAPPESKILIFISRHPDTIYWYWQNIARASGKTVKYVLGKIMGSPRVGIHSSFYVDLDGLATLISEAEVQ